MNYAVGVLVFLVSNLVFAHDFQAEAKDLLACSETEDFIAYEQDCYEKVMARVASQVPSVDEFPPGQALRTVTGTILVRDNSRPELGEAWRDPSGLIWGEPLKAADFHRYKGEATVYLSREGFLVANHEVATKACQDLGARLPTLEEFERLRDYLGGEHAYIPFGLTHLVTTMKTLLPPPPIVGMDYWSSTDDPADIGTIHEKTMFYDFDAHSGKIETIGARTGNWVRCVAQAK